MSKEEEEHFDNSYECFSGEIISGRDKFLDAIGSLDTQSMELLYMLQIGIDKITLMLPNKIKREEEKIFHMILTDFIGEIFGEEFVIALDSIISDKNDEIKH